MLVFRTVLVGVATAATLREEVAECRRAAKSLNDAFMARFERFDPAKESVESYIDRSGLLVNMCLPTRTEEGSGCDATMDHVSASYVSNEVTGWRTFPTGWGTALDPKAFQVRCGYPGDAATSARDDAGCGPVSLDSEYGSQGFARSTDAQKEAIRQQAKDFYDLLGVQAWYEAPCTLSLLDINGVPKKADPQMTAVTAQAQAFDAAVDRQSEASVDLQALFDAAQTYFYYQNQWFEPFLGHPYCYDDSLPCVASGECGNFVVYLGPRSWAPSQFAEVLDAQVALHTRYPEVMEKTFNEIVLDNNAGDDIYKAAFWVNHTDSKARAVFARQAGKVRAAAIGKPLLVANLPWLSADRPYAPWPDDAANTDASVVFSCDERAILEAQRQRAAALSG